MRQRFQNFGPIQLELNRSHLWGRFDSTYVGGRHMHVAKRVPEVTDSRRQWRSSPQTKWQNRHRNVDVDPIEITRVEEKGWSQIHKVGYTQQTNRHSELNVVVATQLPGGQ